MEQIQTAEEFKAAIQRYLKAQEMTVGELAKKIQRPKKTVEWWYYHGTTEKNRRKIQEQYPWLFDLAKETPPEVPPPPLENIQLRLASFVKTEQAREAVLYLTATLEWFLFKATAKERDQFRDELGKDWVDFLGLTRAMTNEKAFEIAREQGELKWNR